MLMLLQQPRMYLRCSLIFALLWIPAVLELCTCEPKCLLDSNEKLISILWWWYSGTARWFNFELRLQEVSCARSDESNASAHTFSIMQSWQDDETIRNMSTWKLQATPKRKYLETRWNTEGGSWKATGWIPICCISAVSLGGQALLVLTQMKAAG